MKEKTGQLGKVPGNKLSMIVNQGRQRLGATDRTVGWRNSRLSDGSAEAPKGKGAEPRSGDLFADGKTVSCTVGQGFKVQWRHAPL